MKRKLVLVGLAGLLLCCGVQGQGAIRDAGRMLTEGTSPPTGG